MKFKKGMLFISYDFVSPADGQWTGPQMTSAYQATREGFTQACVNIDVLGKRADRRNVKLVYMAGGPEPLVVETWDEITKLMDTEWVDAKSVPVPPTSPWCVIIGTPEEGFVVHGPFATRQEAVEYSFSVDNTCWVNLMVKA